MSDNLPATVSTETALPIQAEADQASAAFSEAMPLMMLSLLERRYLADFDASRWRMAVGADDGSRPLLRELTSLGRSSSGDGWGRAMGQVLTATHSPGQAVVMVVHGDGARHRIHFGVRRIPGGSSGSTDDFLVGQSSVLRAHLPGLELGPVRRMDSASLPDLVGLLHGAPALGLVTGIPSPRPDSSAAIQQNLDKLITAVGDRRYVLSVIAEPLLAIELDAALDQCRRLKSEIHSFVRRTGGESRTEGSSTSQSRQEERERSNLPTILSAVAVFCQLSGVLGALPIAGTAAAHFLSLFDHAASPLNNASTLAVAYFGRQAGPTSTVQSSTNTSLTRNGSTEFLNANAEACEALLDAHIRRLEAARSSGWWHTSVYVAAENSATLAAVTGGLRSLCAGAYSSLDPIRVLEPPTWLTRQAIVRGQPIRLVPAGDQRGGSGYPLGPAYDSLGTCLASDELAVLLAPPQHEVPGLPVRDIGQFALSVGEPAPHAIPVGRLVDGLGRDIGPVELAAASLNRHVFVTGMTGYGKTTTAKNVLVEAWQRLEVPFLVIEPVKAEYRALRELAGFGDLRVFSIGGRDDALPLRLNPFMAAPHTSLMRHIDLLKAVFNASFPMFAGMPYVLEEALLEVYTERGWDLDSSLNQVLGRYPGQNDVTAVLPTLADLHDKIEQVLGRKNYAREVHQNMGAALRSRLASLMVGAKGRALNCRRSISADDLFGRPTVIELRNLGDDEEKAFVMALLLGLLYEYAEARQVAGSTRPHPLQHLTLIEEAHRLLKASRGPANVESGDPQAKAVSMFTDMLAEMRAYGEGFIVADQIPTKLAPEILKNSSVKIVHRLAAPDDRGLIGASMNLTDEQSRHLVTLAPGRAIVHDDRLASAVQVQMQSVQAAPAAGVRRIEQDRSYLRRDGGCVACSEPCTFLDTANQLVLTTPAADAHTFFEAVLDDDADAAWSALSAWLAVHAAGAAAHRVPAATLTGVAYCALTRAAVDWLRTLGAVRSDIAGSSRLSPGEQVAADRGARAVGRLIRAWLAIEELDEPARSAFRHAGEKLRGAVAASPPALLEGCLTCPAPCRLLARVAPHLAALGSTVAARATQPGMDAGARLRGVSRAVDDVWSRDLRPIQRDHATYCLVTVATRASAADPATRELLSLLREGSNG